MNLEHLSKGQIHEELAFMTEKAKRDIIAWKSHLLRSVNQDKARLDILRDLDDISVLLVQDWAMKFIPRKYRESQRDWFGKQGIPGTCLSPWERKAQVMLESTKPLPCAMSSEAAVKIAVRYCPSCLTYSKIYRTSCHTYSEYTIDRTTPGVTIVVTQSALLTWLVNITAWLWSAWIFAILKEEKGLATEGPQL